MSDKIEKILNSIKGIKPAEVKPYFYTRLSTKLDTVQNKEAFYLKYERPFLIMLDRTISWCPHHRGTLLCPSPLIVRSGNWDPERFFR